VNALKRTLKVGIAIFSGYFSKHCPRRNEVLMRHIIPKFLVVDGIVSPEAFILRTDETTLSWRIRRHILLPDEALIPYVEHYSFVRKKKIKTTPGLIGLSAFDLWRQQVFPVHDPEPPFDNKNKRPNPYAILHYASTEPSPESRVALAAIATEKLLLQPCEESVSDVASTPTWVKQ
jgi:hypothetical protein